MSGDAKLSDPRILQVLGIGVEDKRHSPLYLWMREHHATLQAEFEANGPQWAARAKAMADAGLLDGAGEKPTQRTAMQTWYRVCREQRQKRTPAPTAANAEPLPSRAKPPPSVDSDDQVQPSGFEFRFAGGPKIWDRKPG